MAINPIFQRLELLTGTDALDALGATNVIIFGVGGVGSWVADSLVRTGIHNITIVDSDTVCITNINRQLQASIKNIGKSKVEELKQKLLEINPRANVKALLKVYDKKERSDWDLTPYDYVIDAIDSLSHKVDLLKNAYEQKVTVFSSMGAANRLDPTLIQIKSIWDTNVCPLARLVRKYLRKDGFQGDFKCVYSEENRPLARITSPKDGSHKCVCSSVGTPSNQVQADAKDWCHDKAVIPGSAVHITATYGNFLAGLVIQDVIKKMEEHLELSQV
jgi:tRNA A37 threonylcarbamoyladenosine dehydratase